MSSNQPARKKRFEALLTPENHAFLKMFAVRNRRKMSSEVDFIVNVMRLKFEQAEKEKAPNVVHV